MPSYRQIFKSTGLLGSVQALYIAISVVRNKVAALLIGAAGMGLADLYTRAIELVGNCTNFGLSLSAVKQLAPLLGDNGAAEENIKKEKEKAFAQVANVRTWVLATALLGMAVCAALSPLLSKWLTDGYDHAAAFALLAPAVGAATITSGEVAVLKAARRLTSLARATAAAAFFTLLLCAAFYGLWGVKGIVPVIVFSALFTCLLTLRESCKAAPYRLVRPNAKTLREGVPLLRLGLAYILAGVMASLAEMLIRAMLMQSDAGLSSVGLYAAGFTLTVSYSRLLFVAVDADYFPRLTASLCNLRARNVTIDRQINTLVVLMSPFLIAYALALPLCVRVLYTSEFVAVVPMVLAALSGMYFKAIYTPIAYLPLAHGHSLLYMAMELGYNVVFCIAVVAGWHFGGLLGAGVGLMLANLCDLIAVSTVYHLRYHYSPSRGTLVRTLLLFLPLLLGIFAATRPTLPLRLLLSLLALALTLPAAWPVVKRVRK